MCNSNENYSCPFCGTEYKLQWEWHTRHCFMNPANLKSFGIWLTEFVTENSVFGDYKLIPLVRDWKRFTDRAGIISPKWTMQYLQESDPYECYRTILEHGVLVGAITNESIAPEILFLYDAQLFLTIGEYQKREKEFEELESFLLSH